MKERIKELDELLKHRRLADGDDTVDRGTLRLMELRVQLTLAEEVEKLHGAIRNVKETLRSKF